MNTSSSIKLKSLVIRMPTRVELKRVVPTRVVISWLVPTRVATSEVVPTRVVQSYSKEVQFLPACCEQRVTYLVIGINDLELESTFLEQTTNSSEPIEDTFIVKP
jgi:hypothetical protein